MRKKYRFLKTKALFQIFLILTLTIFTGFSLASTDVEAAGCCRDYGNGQTCVNTDSGDGCVDYGGASCESDAGCGKLGCCVVGELCSENVASYTCDSDDGEWNSGLCSEGNNKAVCVKGCCVIGNNAFLTTESSCKEMFNGDYHEDINIQDSCTDLVAGSEEGCCVDGNTYKYGLRNDCSGEFYNGAVCSTVAGYSEAGYTSHSKSECGPMGTSKYEDVYWYDSSGNLEEIKENCNPDDLSEAGSICGDNDKNGEYTCESLDCATTWDNPAVDGDGGYRKNGESWCEYQAAVGPGQDLPGTQHYVHKCEKGREVVEPCAGDRSTICIQNNIDFGDVKVGSASCVFNTYEECIKCKGKECCANPDLNCVWIEESGKCLSIVPPASVDYCKKGTIKGYSYWHKACRDPTWDCKEGEAVFKDQFLFSGNTLCRTYGDCGAAWNLAQEYNNKGYSRPCNGKEPIAGCTTKLSDKLNPFKKYESAGVGLFLGNVTAEEILGDNAKKLGGRAVLGMLNSMLAVAFKAKGQQMVSGRRTVQSFMSMLKIAGLALAVGAGFLIAGIVAAVAVGTATAAETFAFGAVSMMLGEGGAAACAGGPILCLIGLIIIIIAIIILIVEIIINFKAFMQALGHMVGCNKDAIVNTKTKCSAWTPPQGGDDCSMCQTKIKDGGVLPDYAFPLTADSYPAYECYAELCTSLGTQCQFEEDPHGEGGPIGPRCVKVDKQDINLPLISIDYANTKYYCNQDAPGGSEGCTENTQTGIIASKQGSLEKGAEINGLLVDLYENAVKDRPLMNISITTNEDAICMYNTDAEGGDRAYEEMHDEFAVEDLEGGHLTTHTLQLKGSLAIGGEHTLYVRCEDWNLNSNDVGYMIKYKVAEQPDFSPPIIDGADPESGSYLKYGENSSVITLRVSEPIVSEAESETDSTGAGCKWSKTPNLKYSEMANETLMHCDDEEMICSGILEGVEAGDNIFYFKCRDNSGNANEQDYSYNLKLTEGVLNVGDVACEHRLPDGFVSNDCANVYARNFTLIANTDGGIDGSAVCSYSGVGGGPFFETGGKTHKQQFGGDGSLTQGLMPGSYDFKISCIDDAENTAEKEVGVSIKIDNSEPAVKRFYVDSGILYIVTDEYAKCYYDNTRDFRYDEAKEMAAVSADRVLHSVGADKSYYRIGCIDRFNNYMTPINVYL